MKKYNTCIIRWICCGLACTLAAICVIAMGQTAQTSPSSEPSLVPWPRSVQMAAGAMPITAQTRIVVSDESLKPLANVLADEIELAWGVRLSVATGDQAPGDIALTIDPAMKGAAQAINITDRAIVRGANYDAIAMGTATLLQAIHRDGQSLSLPAMTISDEPFSKFCGTMVDIARRYYSIDVLKQCVEMCRLYKIHYLVLHMTDDQSFTFPSTAYPSLGKQTSWMAGRNGPCPYKLADLKDLSHYADERGVAIVPELEGPGHSGALQRELPEIFGVKDPKTGKYHGASVDNVANPEIYKALDTIVGEMCDVFSSTPYFHIGGDESYWADFVNTDEAKKYMAETGLDPGGMHTEYLNKMDEIVKKHGKTTICWESFGGNSKVNKDIVVMAWQAGHADLIRGGYKIINVPWTVQIGSSVKANYLWNMWQVCGENRPIVQMPRSDSVIGAEMVLWEHPGEQAIDLLRLKAVARNERVYNPDAGKSFDDFQKRIGVTDALLDHLILPVRISAEGFRKIGGVAPPDGQLQPEDQELFDQKLTITLQPLDQLPNQTIHYTLDGKEPTLQSPVYTAPFELTEKDTRHWQPNVNFEPISEAIVKARVFSGSEPRGFTREAFYHFDWIAKMPRHAVLHVYELPKPVNNNIPASGAGLKLVYSGLEPWINLRGLPHVRMPENFLAEWEGTMPIDKEGDYTLSLASISAVTQIWVDGKLLVNRTNRDWDHTAATLHLAAGDHPVKVRYCGSGDFMFADFKPAAGAERAGDIPLKIINPAAANP